MKQLTLFVLATICAIFSVRSQDLGYKTVDVGGQFQWYSKGYISALHLAYNARYHHAVQALIGYNKSNWKKEGKHDNEEGGGPGFSIGYRYYFLVKPHGFFLGARTDLWRLIIDWRQGLTTGRTKTWTIQPTIESGYMLLINDMFFVTPSIAAGSQSNISTKGQAVGEGSVFLFGVSAGWKF